MTTTKATIREGAFIVLEGLDATGKSTQLAMFQQCIDREMWSHDLLLTHQPSGGSPVGEAVYEVTENGNIESATARQFLHLASHAEHYKREIIPALDDGIPVVMDRCWWSTMAYGAQAVQAETGVGWSRFQRIAQMPTQGRHPDVVFLFKEPWQEDRHNTPQLLENYERLQEENFDTTFVVPRLDPEQTFVHILMTLADLELTS